MDLITENVSRELIFAPENFLDNLPYMGKGMLVIFAVIGIIILATMAINHFFSK